MKSEDRLDLWLAEIRNLKSRLEYLESRMQASRHEPQVSFGTRFEIKAHNSGPYMLVSADSNNAVIVSTITGLRIGQPFDSAGLHLGTIPLSDMIKRFNVTCYGIMEYTPEHFTVLPKENA